MGPSSGADERRAAGGAAAALGHAAEAQGAFRAAIQLRSAWADAWVEPGLARYRQGADHDVMNLNGANFHFGPCRSRTTVPPCGRKVHLRMTIVETRLPDRPEADCIPVKIGY